MNQEQDDLDKVLGDFAKAIVGFLWVVAFATVVATALLVRELMQ